MKKFNGYKYCWNCEEVLPITMFSIHRYKNDGLRDECKGCYNVYKYGYDKVN